MGSPLIDGRRGSSEFSTTDLDTLERQLDAWRRRQGKQSRLPVEVWESAGLLARALGVSQVSRRLRLGYHKLSRWMGQRGHRPPNLPPPTFVELAVAAPSGVAASPEFRAELAGPDGAGLTLHLGREAGAVVALAEAFWRRER